MGKVFHFMLRRAGALRCFFITDNDLLITINKAQLKIPQVLPVTGLLNFHEAHKQKNKKNV